MNKTHPAGRWLPGHWCGRAPANGGLVFSLLLLATSISPGQTLHDLIISLSDRQRVIEQRAQVEAALNDSAVAKESRATPAGPRPIEWNGVGMDPAAPAVEALDTAAKVALLNQAAGVFELLDNSFLNLDPADLEKEAVGALIPHARDDFGKLPVATAGNFDTVLASLARRTRGLRVLVWPSAFEMRTYEDGTYLTQTVVRDDPQDKDRDKRHGARVVNSPEIDPASLHASFIGPGNHDFILGDPVTEVKITSDATVQYSGECTETSANDAEITQPLHELKVLYQATYPASARVAAVPPGDPAGQIHGTVIILRRSLWHGIRTDDTKLSPEFAVDDARYHVVGKSRCDAIPLFTNPPVVVVKGKWLPVAAPGNASPDAAAPNPQAPVRKVFVADGCKYQANSLLAENDRNYSADYQNSYERQWQVGCRYFSIFKPDFVRGLDAPATVAPEPDPAEQVPAPVETDKPSDGPALENSDGALLLHPRPDLLFGIRLGPGLHGEGDAMIACHVQPDGTFLTSSLGGWLGGDDAARTRFDSSYRLGFAGSATDYHVVYDNDRVKRKLALPDLAWPMTTAEGTTYNFTRLLHQWDSPRLRQIIGRDLIADIEYTNSHYGYVVKIYRRPADRVMPEPGVAVDTSTLTPVRTWAAIHPDQGGTPYLNDAEKLRITGGDDETFVIYTNAPPSETRETGSWWQWTPGEFTWTFKRSEGTSEKYKKEIRIRNEVGDGKFRHETTVDITMDGKRAERKTSTKADPFISGMDAEAPSGE